jgi:hypothetical protein
MLSWLCICVIRWSYSQWERPKPGFPLSKKDAAHQNEGGAHCTSRTCINARRTCHVQNSRTCINARKTRHEQNSGTCINARRTRHVQNSSSRSINIVSLLAQKLLYFYLLLRTSRIRIQVHDPFNIVSSTNSLAIIV